MAVSKNMESTTRKIYPSSDMDLDQIGLDPLHVAPMAHEADRFCPCLSTTPIETPLWMEYPKGSLFMGCRETHVTAS